MVQKKNEAFLSDWLFPFLIKHKKTLVGSGLLGAAIVFIFCLFVTPKYQSSAIVYAAGIDASNPMRLSEGNSMLLLQILESNYLKDSLITRLKLADHYNIDKSDKNWKQQIIDELDKNISFKRTMYKSVKIRVIDKDPEFAAKMANEIVDLNNKINTKIVKENTSGELRSRENAYLAKKKEVEEVESLLSDLKSQNIDSTLLQLKSKLNRQKDKVSEYRQKIKEIREKHGVHGLNKQVDAVQELYTRTTSKLDLETERLKVYEQKLMEHDSARVRTEALVAGLKKKSENLETLLNNLNKANDSYNQLTNELSLNIQIRDELIRRIETIENTFEPGVQSIEMHKLLSNFEAELIHLAELKKAYDNAKILYEKETPGSYLISKATPNFHKAYPKTLLFITIAFFSSLCFSFFVLLIMRKEKA